MTSSQCLTNVLGPATHLHSRDWRYTLALNPDATAVFFDLAANSTLWGFGKAGVKGASKMCMLPSGSLSLNGEWDGALGCGCRLSWCRLRQAAGRLSVPH